MESLLESLSATLDVGEAAEEIVGVIVALGEETHDVGIVRLGNEVAGHAEVVQVIGAGAENRH